LIGLKPDGPRLSRILAECLGAWFADDLHTIFRASIVKDRERAAIDCATRHRRSASEIVVDRGPVVEIQPHYLFGSCNSITVCGLNLSMVAVLGQDVLGPIRRGTMGSGKTLVPGESNDAD